LTAIASDVTSSDRFTRAAKFVQSATLLASAAFLFRSGMDASLSDLFSIHPNSIATIWGDLATTVALLLIPTSFAVLSRLRLATLIAIALSTLAISIYAAQALLLLVDRVSDQTYLLLNPYLKSLNPILPLSVSLIAMVTNIFRLKTYQPD
jgi:hypothetical protein